MNKWLFELAEHSSTKSLCAHPISTCSWIEAINSRWASKQKLFFAHCQSKQNSTSSAITRYYPGRPVSRKTESIFLYYKFWYWGRKSFFQLSSQLLWLALIFVVDCKYARISKRNVTRKRWLSNRHFCLMLQSFLESRFKWKQETSRTKKCEAMTRASATVAGTTTTKNEVCTTRQVEKSNDTQIK